jgi:hypothetical protein
LRALETWHGIETPDCFRVLPTAPHLLDVDHRDALLRLVADLPESPRLIVVDTLARVLSGGDENTSRDVGTVIDAVAELQLLTGAAVLIVHHNSKAGSMRGSSALEGAADVILRTKRDGDVVTIETTKMKDAEEPAPIHLVRRIVTLSDDDPDDASLVFVMASAPSGGTNVERVARLFHTHFGHDEISTAVWRRVCVENGLSESSFYRTVQHLIDTGRFAKSGSGNATRYRPAGPQGGTQGAAQTVNTQITLDGSDR